MRIALLTAACILTACRSDEAVKAFNNDPTATITSHADGDEVTEGVVTTFRGSVSDANHDTASLKATWFAGNEEICPSTPPDADGISTCEATLGADVTEVRLEVQDPNDAAGVASVTISVVNPPPQVAISSHDDGDSLTEGELITLVGAATDANHEATALLATWYTGSNVLCEETALSELGVSSCEFVLTPDDTEITLEVVDPGGEKGEASITFEVNLTESPEALIISPEVAGVYYSDQKITFEGVVSDAEDDADMLVASWKSDIDGDLTAVAAVPNNAGSVVGYGYLTEGEHAIELQVEDNLGKSAMDSVIITVGPPNSVPLCEITSPASGAAGAEGELVLFTGTVSDVDVPFSYLSVSWESDKDGALGTSTPDSSGAVSFPLSSLSVNTHVLSMIVTDEVGAECVANTIYTVGTPPSVSIDSPVDGSTYSEGEALSFVATVSDGQDSPDDLALTWDVNGTLLSTQSATSSGIAQFTDATLAAGSYTLTLTATDSDGLTDNDQLSFSINGLPTAPSVSISPDPAYTTDQLVAVASGSVDPEGSTVNYSYEWLQNGVLTAHTTAVVAAAETMRGEIWTVRVTPNDGLADGPSTEATITIANSAPTISAVTISPASGIYYDTTLTCSATATDADEALTVAYAWSMAGNAVGSGDSLDLSGLAVSAGDAITCTASATDGAGASASDSATVSVENTPPSVDSVGLSPSIVYTEDTLSASAVLSDPDTSQGLTATYAWHVIDADTGIDAVVQTGASSALSGTLYFDRDDEVYVVVTANDGTDDGAPFTSSSVVVSNLAPQAPTISLMPNPATAGQDDLVCSVDVASTDLDQDTVYYTYVWTDPAGTVQQTTAATTTLSDTFAAAGTTQGSWTCVVTAADDSASATAVSATTTVLAGCSSVDFQSESLTIPASGDFAVSTALTLETWLKWDNDGRNWYPIIQHGWGTNNSLYYFSLTGSDQACSTNHLPGTPMFEFKSPSGGDCFYAAAPLPEDQWVHLAVVFESGQLRMYIQGAEVKSRSTSTSQFSTVPMVDLRIGFSPTSGTSYFNGQLSHLQINAAARYNGSFDLADTFAADANTVAFWTLDEGSGSVIYDSSGNGHDGTNDGAAWVDSCPDEDMDADGVSAWEDCDDDDASVGSSADDADCDGTPTNDDCDDEDPTVYPYAGDTYGDGVDGDCDNLDCTAWTFGTTYFALCPANGGVGRSTAASQCLSAGYDGLASILSQAEHDSIKANIATMPQSAMNGSMGNSYGWAWIGLMGPVLQWDSGLPYSYDGMSAGGDDDGMVYWRLVGYGQHDWGWNDTSDPNEVIPYLCEIR